MIVGGEDHRSELPVSPKKRFDALEKYLAGLLGGRSYQIVRKWIGASLERWAACRSLAGINRISLSQRLFREMA
jgi:hypothetical protein